MEKIIIELRKFVEIHRVLQDETLEHFAHTPLNQNLNQISLLVGDLERALAEHQLKNGKLPIPLVSGSLSIEEMIFKLKFPNEIYEPNDFNDWAKENEFEAYQLCLKVAKNLNCQ